MTFDKAGKDYWDHLWENRPAPRAVDPEIQTLENYPNTRFHALFTELFSGRGKETKLLEIGCAGSEWLPYFRKQFGFEVSGLDYSEIGCEQARAVLKAENTEGTVFLVDFFNPPQKLVGLFDIVISFGVMEHFEETSSALKAGAALLKDDGMLITIIPNLAGMIGSIQSFMSVAIFNKHKILGIKDLDKNHGEAGLFLEGSFYFLSTSFNVLNISDAKEKEWFKKTSHLWLTRLSKLIWLFERKFFKLPATRLFSPYVICVARKKK